jgi:hypothetical protein
MTDPDARIDEIVDELLERPHTKAERIELLRELVREQESVPDALLEAALVRLMDRLAE